jgi:hypothetical protein
MAFSSSPHGSTMISIANVVAYIVNLVTTYGVGTLGWFGAATNAELSEKYQTLITPVGWAFSIWAIIFLAQLVWSIVQLLPAFRGDPLVAAVGWNYVLVCVAQIGWTISFSLEIIWLSLVCMLAILLFLVMIVRAQGDSDFRGYMLLKFPFSIHTGWILAASFVNVSVLLVSLEVSAQIQYYVAMASLSIILVISGVFIFDITILLVLAWASVRTGAVDSCALYECSRSLSSVLAGNLHRTGKPQ